MFKAHNDDVTQYGLELDIISQKVYFEEFMITKQHIVDEVSNLYLTFKERKKLQRE